MSKIMPSQVVRTIDTLFPTASQNISGTQIATSLSPQLLGVINLVRQIPDELLDLPASDFADLVLATSAIDASLQLWMTRGGQAFLTSIGGFDPVTVIRRVLAHCPDEHPLASTAELLFITDIELRGSIRRDVGAAGRALQNNEWKAATVLAGAAIEAMLHWKIQQHPLTPTSVQSAIDALPQQVCSKQPYTKIDYWDLSQFIEVAAELALLKPDSAVAAKLLTRRANT